VVGQQGAQPQLPFEWQVGKPADASTTLTAAASAVKRYGHVQFGGVVIEAEIIDSLN